MTVMHSGKWRPATSDGSCPAVISPIGRVLPEDSYRLLCRAARSGAHSSNGETSEQDHAALGDCLERWAVLKPANPSAEQQVQATP